MILAILLPFLSFPFQNAFQRLQVPHHDRCIRGELILGHTGQLKHVRSTSLPVPFATTLIGTETSSPDGVVTM
jgi:hypothetical protein